MKLATATTF